MWVEKNGKTWRIRDERGGKKIDLETGFRTKTAAKAAMVHLKSERLRGTDLVPRGGKILLNDWLDEWQPGWELTLKATSRLSEPGRIRNHIRPLLGTLPLEDIDQFIVQRWVATLVAGVPQPDDPEGLRRRPLSAKTIHNCHGLLYTIMGAAAGKLIRTNPCASTNLPRIERREMMFLTEEEFGRLLRHVPSHWQALVLTLVTTGARWGEAIGLRVHRVNLSATPPRILIEEQLQEMPGTAELVFQTPKTEQSRRTLDIDSRVANLLAPRVADKDREDLVFRSVHGNPVRTRNFRRIWKAACRRAGFDGLRVHDLRHTHASWLISKGVPLTSVQRRMGHTSIIITSDLYGHLTPEADAKVAAAISEALAGVDLASVAWDLADELADPVGA